MTRTGRIHAVVLAVILVAIVADRAPAQTIVGRTVAASTDAPLAGVFVTLTNAAGDRVAGFLSRADGRFLIRAPGPGTFTLRSELIGYGSLEQVVELGEGGTVQMDVQLPLEAVQLEGIVARGTRQRDCALRSDEGNALSRLWSEARKGLAIADWAEETGWLRANGYTYQRVLDPVELEVLAETVSRQQSLERKAFVAADPETLREEGFVLTSRAGAGAATYHGADAALLLSDAFTETHCFSLRERPGEGLVGIGFEPVSGREVPDIRGTLWLEAETGRLRTLEYDYTRYPVTVPLPKSRVGGRTVFRHLPGGGVAVEEWRIRMPSLNPWADLAELRAVRRCGMDACEDPETLRRLSRAGLAVQEEGGRVLSFRLADGTRLPAVDRAAVTGSVIDSTVAGAPEPLSGAQVRIRGTDHEAVSDARGRFRFDNLPEGTYRLEFHHPKLAELGVERPAAVVVTATRGEVASTTLATPSWSTLASAWCAARDQEEQGAGEIPTGLAEDASRRGAIVHGLVRDAATGAAIHRAAVRLESATGTALEQETDPAGRYLFCAAPAAPVRLSASYLGKGGQDVRVEPAADRPLRINLDLVLSTSARLLGRVVRADDLTGVGGAVVRIRESGRTAVTDESGRFGFEEVSPGALTLETEHIAYRPSEGAVAVSGGELVRVELRVAEEVFDLEPLVVTVRSRPLLMDEHMKGFYVRQARGIGGTFIDREILNDRPAARVTGLLREFSSISVPQVGNGRILTSTRNPGGASGNNPFCTPMVYLDGTILTNRLGEPLAGESKPDPSPLNDVVRIIDEIPSSEIVGIEIYPGAATVPGEFAGLETQCGVVAIWTRVSDQSLESR